ncbi:MAG: hypothetical protein A2275_05375 [Bacteroidetes bacterium RIFOXYA12_FULL_35_11]|nr:MAG: hypothetical protein A2X01_10755 [Bacteroidetes bacterium GWF2_35_48]OFY73820.1 MAG: hypothetical protein A2275_05375 [Bacteroidetes bacterium RIFOXYA12_FULL_35_11]OFY98621.1 MAG: hypothetical protein A2491_05225 [Bacteroidetes bacterium RIFOXYC12_FULL_35_7]HBX50414.1 hypothetical protein [Bacteroidales bacterium]
MLTLIYAKYYYGVLHLGFSMSFIFSKYFAALPLYSKYSSRAAITFVAAIAALFTKVQRTGILLF